MGSSLFTAPHSPFQIFILQKIELRCTKFAMRNAILNLILAMLACLISSSIAMPANNTINANIAMPAKAVEGFTSPCVVRRLYFFVQCVRD
jgi:hypothetical protein